LTAWPLGRRAITWPYGGAGIGKAGNRRDRPANFNTFSVSLNTMKTITTIITAIIICFHAHGQLFENKPKREQLRGYKQITEIAVNQPSDSVTYTDIRFVNDLGDITRSESYDNKTLTGWTKYEYNSDGQLIYEERHDQVFSYDEQKKDHVGKIRDDDYHARTLEYQNKRLAKETQSSTSEGRKTYNSNTTYEYNRNGQLIKEIYTDYYTGLVVTFKPGTDVMDSACNRQTIKTYTTVYSYKANTTTIAAYDKDNYLSRYWTVELSATKKPTSILRADEQKKPVELTRRFYDKDDNVIRETNKIINPNKAKSDKFSADEVLTTYNERNLPILVVMKESGKVVHTTQTKYE
jgi:hypothetical protein